LENARAFEPICTNLSRLFRSRISSFSTSCRSFSSARS
jgi:hypothetical protein